MAASAVAGVIAHEGAIPDRPVAFAFGSARTPRVERKAAGHTDGKPVKFKGRVWVVKKDNIDTDMIFHNRYLAITDIAEMGQYAFDNLAGWEDFSRKVCPGDILVTGANFGAGSSRQQAVDCFKSLGISLLIAESYGAIYERNAINAGMPIMEADLADSGIESGEEIEVDLARGEILRADGGLVMGRPFSEVQLAIYQRGGLLAG